MSAGGHLGCGVSLVVLACRLPLFTLPVLSAMLLSRNALWSDPRSIAIVDSQSFTVFQNRRFVKM